MEITLNEIYEANEKARKLAVQYCLDSLKSKTGLSLGMYFSDEDSLFENNLSFLRNLYFVGVNVRDNNPSDWRNVSLIFFDIDISKHFQSRYCSEDLFSFEGRSRLFTTLAYSSTRDSIKSYCLKFLKNE